MPYGDGPFVLYFWFCIDGRRIKISFVRSLASARLFRRRDIFFDGAKIFEKLDRGDAIDFVKKSLKSELSSRFSSRSKFWQNFNKKTQEIDMPLFGKFVQSSRDLAGSDHDSRKSRDDWPSSPKSGVWNFEILLHASAWEQHIVLLGSHESSWLGTMSRLRWERRILSIGNNEFSRLETTNLLDWKQRFLSIGNNESSSLETRNHFLWKQRIVFFWHGWISIDCK